MIKTLTFVIHDQQPDGQGDILLSLNGMLSNIIPDLLEIYSPMLLKEIDLLTVNNRLATLLQFPEEAFESYCSVGHNLRDKLEDLYHITKYATDNNLAIVVIFD